MNQGFCYKYVGKTTCRVNNLDLEKMFVQAKKNQRLVDLQSCYYSRPQKKTE